MMSNRTFLMILKMIFNQIKPSEMTTIELTTKLHMTNEAINGFCGQNFPKFRQKLQKDAELLSAQISALNLKKSDWIYQALNKAI